MGSSASSSSSSQSSSRSRHHNHNSNIASSSNRNNHSAQQQQRLQQQQQQQQFYQQQFMQMQQQQALQQQMMMNPSQPGMPMRQNQAPLPIKPQSNVNVMQNDIILRKSSVNIISNSDQSLSLEFEFDALKPVVKKVDASEQKQLFYYFEIIKNADSFKPHLKKQVLEYNSDSFEIQEIYGVENTDLINGEAASQSKQANMEDCNKECIICMTDLIDTVIMPCRHMCICIECAKTFQKKKTGRNCPVCRKEIESFLRIQKLQHQQQQQQPSIQNPMVSANNQIKQIQ